MISFLVILALFTGRLIFFSKLKSDTSSHFHDSYRGDGCAQPDVLERMCDQLSQLNPHRPMMLSYGHDKLLSLRGSASTINPALRYTLDQLNSWWQCGCYFRPRGQRPTARSQVQRSITTVLHVRKKTVSHDHNINTTISNNYSCLRAVGVPSPLSVVSPSLAAVLAASTVVSSTSSMVPFASMAVLSSSAANPSVSASETVLFASTAVRPHRQRIHLFR